MINKSELSLWIFCIFFIFYKDGAKLNDENRPYEFGFTIDGQQHRHERKDANGIVQGEFGFITADGVYHVTVYATDENGRFKILSMRNIKISEPLDGLQVGSYTTKPLSIGQSISSTSSAANDQNIGFSTSAAVPQDVSTTKKPILLTTQSTVKQACAGCGYATKVASSTPKSKLTLDIGGLSTITSSKGNQNLDLNGLPVVSYTTNPLPTSQYVSSTSSATINVNQNVALSTSTSIPKPAVIENVQNVQVANLGEAVNKPAVITSQGFGNTVVSTTKKPILFTTQSTIKPACASCGYVTRVSSSTPKSESTPGFNEINLQSKINGSVGGLPGNVAGVPGNVAGLPGNLAGGYNAGLQTITSSNKNQNLGNQQSVEGQQSNIPIIEGVPSVQNMPGYQGVTNQNTLQASVANDNQRYPIGLTPGNVGNLNGNVQTSVIQSVSSQSNLNVPNEQKQAQTFDANQNYQDTTSLNQNQFDSQSNLGGQNVAKQENQNIRNQGNQNIPHDQNRGNQNIPSPGTQNVPYLTNQGEQKVPYPGKQENENIPSSGNQANIPSQNAPGETVPNQYIQGTSLQNRDQPQTSQTPSTNLQSQMDRATPKPHSIVDDIKIEDNAILVPNNPPIPIKDKYPGMKDGLPNGITPGDISDLLYKFNYTIGFHGHYEMGWRNGTKIGGYFVNGRDGISRVVTYVADELGYRPKFKLINLGYDSPLTPKEETEKSFGLQSFEFVWYPLK